MLGDLNQGWQQVWFGLGGEPDPDVRRRRPRARRRSTSPDPPARRGCSTNSCSTAGPRRGTDGPSPTIPSCACSSPTSPSAWRSRRLLRYEGACEYGGHLHQAITKEFQPEFAQTCMEILGPLGQIQSGEWAPLAGEIDRIYRRSFGNHAGGTSQVKRMVVATRGARPSPVAHAPWPSISRSTTTSSCSNGPRTSSSGSAARPRSCARSRTATSGTRPTSGRRWPSSAGWASRFPERYGGARRQLPRPLPDLRGDGPLPGAEPAPRHRRGRGRDHPRRPAPTRSSERVLLPAIARRRLHRQPRDRSRATARSGPTRSRARRERDGSDFVVRRDEAARGVRAVGRPLPRARCAPAATGARRHLAVPRRRARRRHHLRRRSRTSPATRCTR